MKTRKTIVGPIVERLLQRVLIYVNFCAKEKIVPRQQPVVNINLIGTLLPNCFSNNKIKIAGFLFCLVSLTLLHSERPKLYAILVFLSAIGLTTTLSYCI